MEHDYPNAIEYRFSETQDVKITNNGVNRESKKGMVVLQIKVIILKLTTAKR